MSGRLIRRLQLRDEDGIALVLAVLILAIVTIAAASAIYYTSSSQQDAASKKGGLSAYSLAQAALSNANAQLITHYYDDTGQPYDNTTSLSDQASWAPSGSQQSPTSTLACTSTSSCMSWSAELCPGGTCPDGSTIKLTGFDQAMWHITAIGTTPNPSASGPLRREITIDVPVQQPTGTVGSPSSIFQSVYSGKGPTPGTCDMTMNQNTQFESPVYVAGNLCISNPYAGVYSPGTLAVGGWLDMSDGVVGQDSSHALSSVAVASSCTTKYGGTTSPCKLTKVTSGSSSYYTDDPTTPSQGEIFSTSQASNSPRFPAPPVVSMARPAADSADAVCTGSESLQNSSPFDLAPSTDYSCTTASGQGSLSWNASTKTLTIHGNVYISNDMVTYNGPNMVYQGLGGIFVGGSVNFSNNTSICIVGQTPASHDCPFGADPTKWDTSQNFLMILAHGAITGDKNFGLEGGLYSDTEIDFLAGTTDIYGPLITPGTLIPGQQAASGVPYVKDALTDWPDTPTPFWTLGTPTNGTY